MRGRLERIVRPQRFFAGGRCAKAEPAADLEALLVLPSLSTAEAAFAALGEVTREGLT